MFNIGNLTAAMSMGQQINADIDEKRADTALKKQQLQMNQMAMASQQQKAAMQKQEQEGFAAIVANADSANDIDKQASGEKPNAAATDITAQAVKQYTQMSKVAFKAGDIQTGVEMGRLAEDERKEQRQQAKDALDVKEKQVKDEGAFAGAVLSGSVPQAEAFSYVMKTEGLKEAMKIPTDEVGYKKYWQAKQLQAVPASEQVQQAQTALSQQLSREQAMQIHADNEKDRALQRQALAESRAQSAREFNLKLAQYGEEHKSTLTPGAVNQLAWDKLLTGKDIAGMGNAKDREATANRLEEIRVQLGMSNQEVAMMSTDKKALAKAQAGMNQWGAFVEKSVMQLTGTPDGKVKGTMDLTIDAAKKLSPTDIQAVNNMLLEGKTQFGSGPAASYAQLLNTWRSEYIRLLSGPTSNGMLHTAAEEKADDMIRKGSSIEQLYSLKEATLQEAKATKGAISSELDSLHSKLLEVPGVNGAGSGSAGGTGTVMKFDAQGNLVK